jgi:hypothetical protein
MDAGVFIAQRIEGSASIARICYQSDREDDLHLELEDRDLHLTTATGGALNRPSTSLSILTSEFCDCVIIFRISLISRNIPSLFHGI